MPITDNDTQVTVEFPYDSHENGTRLWIKYHVIDDIPTVSVSENKSEWFNFPASLFSDVTDYLRQKSLISPSSTSVTTKISPQSKQIHFRNQPQTSSPNTNSLPAPQITRSNMIPKASQFDEEQGSSISPIESFSNIAALAAKTSQTLESFGQTEKINRPVLRGESAELQRKAMSSGEKGIKRTS